MNNPHILQLVLAGVIVSASLLTYVLFQLITNPNGNKSKAS